MPTIFENNDCHIESAGTTVCGEFGVAHGDAGPANRCGEFGVAYGDVESARKQQQTQQQRQHGGDFGVAHGDAEPANRKQEAIGQIRTLITIVPTRINSVQADGWEEVDLVVDSGASETVIPPDMI